ncbi:MAG TPA: ABC transporter permease subunit, partial [Polyangiaceae bacterium]|nr:ABC transporter permease subunit [Polyangiaceae bacterium]
MEAATPAVSPELDAPPSYWGSVWRRLSKNRVATFGLWCVTTFCVLAIAAPLLSLNQPFYWNAGNGLQFPWFGALFNRLLFENGVDLFFNGILAFSPLWLATYGVLRVKRGQRWLAARLPKFLLWILAFHVLLLAAMAPESWGFAKNPLYGTSAVINYRVEQQELQAQGKSVTAMFPLRAFSYRETEPTRSVQAPSAEHWLGTDTEGRDVFARMLYGTRISLTIGVVAVLLYVGIGIVLGALAGYFGGWVDNAISRLIEVVICFPSFFLILTLAALIEERSIFHVMVIIGITSWTG